MKKKPFEESLYQKFSLGDLIVFSIYSLGKKAEFEQLVKECFTLFPAAFSFRSFSEWPDSRKLDRSLRSLRREKLIKGNPQTSFSLTKAGEKRAEAISRDFRQERMEL